LKIAVENLRQGVSQHTSIQFIRRILRTFPADNTTTQA